MGAKKSGRHERKTVSTPRLNHNRLDEDYVEMLRGEYLASKGKPTQEWKRSFRLPIIDFLVSKGRLPKNANVHWESEIKFRAICEKAINKRKLPELLPEWVYDRLEADINARLTWWLFWRLSKDPQLISFREQARKRVRKAWEALFVPLDGREKFSFITLLFEYDLELIMLECVLVKLRQVATPSGRIWDADKKTIAGSWDLTSEEVEQIWSNKDRWRSHARTRLANRIGLSIERLNRLIPKRRRVARI